MSKLTLIPEVRVILGLITLKAIKTGHGHDLAGLNCKVYIGKKYIGMFDDDGRGGEADFHEAAPGTEAELVKLMREHNYHQFMYDNGWDFMGDDSTSIGDDDIVVSAINQSVNLNDIMKTYKRRSKKNILVGVPFTVNFGEYSYKHPLEVIAKHPTGGPSLVKLIEKAVKELNEGEMILNGNLLDLGLELTKEVKSKILA